MSNDIDALFAAFKVVLELPQSPARLEQLGLEIGQIEALTARYARHRERDMQRILGLTDGRRGDDRWYTGPREDDVYWPALVSQLSHSPTALQNLEQASSQIVSHLHHPKQPSFATRGLVVAYPQAGTTTNIASVIAKAADRGYRLFIVLAGMHNALRDQMQARLTHQLVRPHPDRWMELTTTRDLQRSLMLSAVMRPPSARSALCVVKKNATVLRRLTDWLAQLSTLLHDYPALIIDADADLPSGNSKSLTPRIGHLLNMLPRAAYLGYTSTPLANLLLEPSTDELFPRDFVLSLPRPPRYTGPEVLFGSAQTTEETESSDDGYDMIRMISHEDLSQLRPASRSQVEEFVPQLPESLRQAVQYFWMVAAARRVRGGAVPRNTMLIHTSVNTAVHVSFLAPLEALRADTVQQLASPDYLERLRQLWRQETQRVAAADFGEQPVTFAELAPHLPSVVNTCDILTDNTASSRSLSTGAAAHTAIVVGGTIASRHLAWDGLSVGYFVPAVSPYETLQQMNRWLGFRPGYEDLARIWMTDDLAAWWREVVDVESGLREQLRRAAQDGISPHSLALKVRSHPKLRVIKAAKQGQGQLLPTISYGGVRVQTHYFHTNADWLRTNLTAARNLVQACTTHASHTQALPDLGRYLFYNVPARLVIDFLGHYQIHERSSEADGYFLVDYIKKRITRANSLKQWNVALLGKPSEGGEDSLTLADGITVGRVIRSRLITGSPDSTDTVDIKTLMSRRDAAIDLAGDTHHLNEVEIRDARRIQLPHTGLLTLYPIDKVSASPLQRPTRAPLNAEEHVIGIGIVFPDATSTDSSV
ncbi:Z1 domain-containing protein [Streptomyces sp. NPDC002491]